MTVGVSVGGKVGELVGVVDGTIVGVPKCSNAVASDGLTVGRSEVRMRSEVHDTTQHC